MLLAWPIVVARSSQAVIGFSDALMTAPLGEDAVAATTTGSMNAFSLVVMPMGLVFIVQSFAAQFKGKNDLSSARRYAWYGLAVAALTSALAIATVPFVGTMISVFPYEPEVRGLMTDYLEIRLFGIGAIVATETLGNWYAGLGNTRLHMGSALIAMVLNVFLNYLLIHGNLGAPEMGVRGAALASVIANWIGFSVLAVIFWRRWFFAIPRDRLRLRWAEFLRMLRFGTPNGLNWFLEFAAFSIFINVVVADLGTGVLAAMMVVIRLNSVAFMPAFGLASAGAIIAGQAIGAGRHDLVAGVVKRTALVAATWQGAIGIIYLVIPATLMAWFTDSDAPAGEFYEAGKALLAISIAWQIFDAVEMTVAETLRAAGDTTWCLWARLAVAWLIFVPGAVISVMVLGGGHIAAMMWLVVYLGVLAVVLTWRFRSGKWKDIDLTGSEAEMIG